MKKLIVISCICIFLGPLVQASNPREDVSRDTPQSILLDENDTLIVVEDAVVDSEFYSDSAYAVDDEVWRQLHLAQEYFAQGVAANQEASWDEAQYYLERALNVMAELDVDTVGNTPEAKRYGSLLSEIVADYRLTLLSLGTLPEDASPSAFLEKFSSMGDTFGDMKVEGENLPVTYDMPIVLNEKVKKSIIYFQTVAREAFEKYLERSGKYIPLMTEIIAEYGIPQDIVYLPLIESGFNCKAFSWARASGPWQFIASTGKLYNLNRNWWYDERRDFVKSTHAAARFLRDLYMQFSDWELALAAYNGGPGRISRTIKKQNTTNFWDMDLRKQTEDYVPFYMAATIIAKNPELYGFDINYDDPLVYDEVVIEKCLDLKTVAKATGSSLEDIQELNPELLRGVTPPKTSKYKLRIPAGTKDQFVTNLPDLRSPQETSWVRHEISRGETVSSIASRYGVSQYAIFEANNLNKRSKIYAGKSIIVPVPLDGGSPSPSLSTKQRFPTGENTYVVEKGDNLWEISRSFNTTPEKLRKLNYLGNSSRIYVGQVLKLPGSNNPQKETVRKDYDREPAGKTGKYLVKKGDTLWDIARLYGTTTATLRRLNGLKRSSRIYVGQQLLVTGDSGPAQDEDYLIYIVRRGDTLSDIARAFQTSVNTLMQLNSISDVTKLRVGTRLKIGKN